MSQRTKPPFRADHVGSLLRPPELLKAREELAHGRITADELRSIEDDAIRDVVRMQEEVGLQSATDGEFRRASWHMDFIYQLDGIDPADEQIKVEFHNEQGDVEFTTAALSIHDKVGLSTTIFGDAFEALKSMTTTTTPKLTIPSPSMVHYRGGQAAIDRDLYPDVEEFWSDLVAAYREEVRRLAELGCTYLQFDDTSLAYLNDPKQREYIASIGGDREHQHEVYIRHINEALADRPEGMSVTTHMCRGNFRSSWAAEGSYEFVAEALFNGLEVDGFFLEYDDARSGGFEPLRFVPKGKQVVLGLVTTKRGELEQKDELKRRVEEASRVVPLEQLCLSPQCGFSSTVEGNLVTRFQQVAKLELHRGDGRGDLGLKSERTQVGIVGAGPAGLVLAQLLHLEGIDSVVLEDRSREHVEQRIRAGVLEQGTVDLLNEIGAGDRLRREGLAHDGIELQFAGERHRIDFPSLTGGRRITVYGQQEVVKDLIATRVETGRPLLFEVSDVGLDDVESDSPVVRFRHHGEEVELGCDFIAGCDGYHGVCRDSIPAGVLTPFERDYPFAWLGILAAAPPSNEELIYAYHERGFALHSMRSPTITRLYLQVRPDEELAEWSHERIWEELERRLGLEGWTLTTGEILEKGITGMRSFVVEPMQHGRLFLAGDAAHIVPPTGAKGLNLAVADVRLLAERIAAWYHRGDVSGLDRYSDEALRRVWRAEHFSWWMTSMLHTVEGGDPFDVKLQLAQLRYVCSSAKAAASLAENYVGLATV